MPSTIPEMQWRAFAAHDRSWDLRRCMSPFLAPFGPGPRRRRCPFIVAKRTSRYQNQIRLLDVKTGQYRLGSNATAVGPACRWRPSAGRAIADWKLERALKCRSCTKSRTRPVHMIKLTESAITPYVWVQPIRIDVKPGGTPQGRDLIWRDRNQKGLRKFGPCWVPIYRSAFMCGYSLHAVATRPAEVSETLVSTRFSTAGTRGFASPNNPKVAVCLRPGTELAFEHDVQTDGMIFRKNIGARLARFRQIDTDKSHQHHDALEFSNGAIVLVTNLTTG